MTPPAVHAEHVSQGRHFLGKPSVRFCSVTDGLMPTHGTTTASLPRPNCSPPNADVPNPPTQVAAAPAMPKASRHRHGGAAGGRGLCDLAPLNDTAAPLSLRGGPLELEFGDPVDPGHAPRHDFLPHPLDIGHPPPLWASSNLLLKMARHRGRGCKGAAGELREQKTQIPTGHGEHSFGQRDTEGVCMHAGGGP